MLKILNPRLPLSLWNRPRYNDGVAVREDAAARRPYKLLPLAIFSSALVLPVSVSSILLVDS